LFGQPAEMDPILECARAHELFVIEDAAQAHGAEYKGRKAGTMGDAGCFSFYPGKNLGAFGEAGAVVTNDPELRKQIQVLRDHGQSRKYYHTLTGWNCRMDGIQAAVLSIKLRYLEEANLLRRKHALEYNRAFSGIDEVRTPFEASYAQHLYQATIPLASRARNRWKCGFLILSTTQGGTMLSPCIAMPVVFTPVLGQRCFIKLITIALFTFGFPAGAGWQRWFRYWKCAVRLPAVAASAFLLAMRANRSSSIKRWWVW